MSAVLRASGPDFDVDAFVRGSGWARTQVYRRGEPVVAARPGGRRRDESGLNIVVSEAGFDDLPSQVADAIGFLEEQGPEVFRLVRFPGVTDAALDFAISRRAAAAQFDRFPPDLVRAAGNCGIGLELSQYLVVG